MVKDLEGEMLSMGEHERNLSEILNQKEALIAELKANQPKPDTRQFVDKQIQTIKKSSQPKDSQLRPPMLPPNKQT